MAKHSFRASAPSRIRFVMVEAELGDGDIGQITQAIQNALRSPVATPASVKRLSAATNANDTAPQSDPESEIDDQTLDDAREYEGAESHAASPKPRSQRKLPPTPNIVEMDMDADVSLASFSLGKDAKSQNKKYLIAAAWLKEHRGLGAITADHIYTCFRAMNWPTNIPDFWQPLRALKAKKFFGTNDKGEYEINHLGLAYVKKLGGTNGVG
jgi:hypothetical protein